MIKPTAKPKRKRILGQLVGTVLLSALVACAHPKPAINPQGQMSWM